MSLILEKQLVAHIFYNPDVLDRLTLKSDDFSDTITKALYSKMKQSEIGVSIELFAKLYESNRNIFDLKDIQTFHQAKKYIFFEYEKEKDFDWLYVEILLKEESKKRKYTEIFEKSMENIHKEGVDTALSNLDLSLRKLDMENPRDIELIKAENFLDLYKERTLEIEELKKSNKPTYYTFNNKILGKHVRMKLGWLWNLVGKTGDGKSIVSTQLTVDFVKNYNERALYVTDENSKEVILTYMYCTYFNIKYHDVEDRIIDLNNHIKQLPDKELKEFLRIFSKIDVIELPCIPLLEVRKILKNAINNDNPYTWVFLDSFDEINSDSNAVEVDRYDANAKMCERVAKDYQCLLGVTNQLATDLYKASIEKIPQLCTHQSKTIVKKCSLSLVLGNEVKKDEDGNSELGSRMKINKCRSGGQGVLLATQKDFDRCTLHISNNEIGKASEDEVELADF